MKEMDLVYLVLYLKTRFNVYIIAFKYALI